MEVEQNNNFASKNLLSDRHETRLGRACLGSVTVPFLDLSEGSIPFTVNGIGHSGQNPLENVARRWTYSQLTVVIKFEGNVNTILFIRL